MVETIQLEQLAPAGKTPWSVTAPPPSDNAEKLRQSVYSSLCYGVKGIEWFCGAILFEPGTSKLRDCGKDVVGLNLELQKLGPILVGLKSLDVFHTPPLPQLSAHAVRQLPEGYWVRTATPDLVLGIFKDSKDNDHVMVANRKIDSTRQLVLSFPPAVTKVSKFDNDKGKWIDLPLSKLGDRVTVKFILACGDGELLRMGL